MDDRHVSKALLELIAIFRAHIANCVLIESSSVRERNLARLAVLQDALIELAKPGKDPPQDQIGGAS
jgi:hypothetical protein